MNEYIRVMNSNQLYTLSHSNQFINTFIHRERRYAHLPQPSEYSLEVRGADPLDSEGLQACLLAECRGPRPGYGHPGIDNFNMQQSPNFMIKKLL